MIETMKSFCLKLAVFAALAFLPALAHAGSEHNLVGWAWSDTIGWISFNSTNDHDPNTAGVQQSSFNYGVHMAGNGDLCGNNSCSVPGYAWSPAIGWIQFGSLSSFPAGSGTQSINAKVNGANVQGWAKAITADSNGWDGWISLSGAGPNYGVNLTGNVFSGYAWGSTVVGWISFDDVRLGFDPPSFTLGGASDTIRIQFLVSGSSDSELRSVPVTTVGGYSSPVTISISTYPTPPVDTTFLYSLGGGAFSTTSPSVVVTPGNSTTLQVRVSKPISAQYTIQLQGVGANATTQYKNMILNPSSQDPNFSEF
jgi:hypothetical protein